MATQDLGDPFLAKALRRFDEIAGRRRDLVSQVEDAQAELREIDGEEAELKSTVEGYLRFMDIEGFPVAGDEKKPRTPHLDLPRGAYAELGYTALLELGGAATLGEIVAHLQRTDRIPKEKYAYYSTRSALNRQPDLIVKTDKGFQLIELKVQEAR
jgi:hypothetical protein